jgi:hypothetical protein
MSTFSEVYAAVMQYQCGRGGSLVAGATDIALSAAASAVRKENEVMAEAVAASINSAMPQIMELVDILIGNTNKSE